MNFLRRLLGLRPSSATTLPSQQQVDPSLVLHRDALKVPTAFANLSSTSTSDALMSNPKAVADQDPTSTSHMTNASHSNASESNQQAMPTLRRMPNPTRQLPPLESFMSAPGKHIAYGVNSDIGIVRSNNQDALYTMFSSSVSVNNIPDYGLFIIADGMGGHHDGEKASALAIRILAQYMNDKFYARLLHEDQDAERPILSEVLHEGVQKANEIITAQLPEGGTTVTAAVILGDLAYIAHVGDSRAYLVTGSELEQITRDHSLVQRLIELDHITPEEAVSHPQKNMLYRALGQAENLEVDTLTRRLPAGSRLVLCSDGLWGQVPAELLTQIILTAHTPQEACDKLVAAANERGGPDNISVIIIQTPG